MHYYQFNISDYRKDTSHLTPLEHYIYRTLIDWYYLDESALPPIEKIIRKLGLTNDRSTVVQQVLNDFFTPAGDCWEHKRIKAEISLYHRQITDAVKAGKASAAARIANKQAALERAFNGRSTEAQPTNNQELITNNQELLKSKSNEVPPPSALVPSKKTTGTRLPDDWALPKEWGDWALSEKPDLNETEVRKMADSFKDWAIANANRAVGKKADWQATWRNWVRNQKSKPAFTKQQQNIFAGNI